MKASARIRFSYWGLLLLTLGTVLLSSCASSDNGERVSARPWNTPRTWEHGMPSGMTEGR